MHNILKREWLRVIDDALEILPWQTPKYGVAYSCSHVLLLVHFAVREKRTRKFYKLLLWSGENFTRRLASVKQERVGICAFFWDEQKCFPKRLRTRQVRRELTRLLAIKTKTFFYGFHPGRVTGSFCVLIHQFPNEYLIRRSRCTEFLLANLSDHRPLSVKLRFTGPRIRLVMLRFLCSMEIQQSL